MFRSLLRALMRTRLTTRAPHHPRSSILHVSPVASGQFNDNQSTQLSFIVATIIGISCLIGSASPAYAFSWQSLNPFSEEGEPVRDAHWYSAHFSMPQEDEALVQLIKDQSLLFTQSDEPVSGANGLINLAKDDFENLIGLLYSKGYYAGLVDIRIDDEPLTELTPLDKFPKSSEDNRIRVEVRIQPQSQFRFGTITISAENLSLSPRAYGLESGEVAESDKVFAAESDIITDLQNQSYALAKSDTNVAIAEHADQALNVQMNIEPGQKAYFGDPVISGTDRMDAAFTAFMLDLPEGEPYDPEAIEKGMSRLRNLDVFNSQFLEEGQTLTTDQKLPMTLTVTERKTRVIGFGAEVSNVDGALLSSYWRHRNLFGKAEQLRLNASMGRLGFAETFDEYDFSLGAEFTKPGIVTPDTDYQAAIKADQEYDDDVVNRRYGVSNQINYQHDEHRSMSGGFGIAYIEDKDLSLNTTEQYLIASAPLQYRLDFRDNVTNTEEGWLASASLEPGFEFRSAEPFIKAQAEGAYYLPLDEDQRFIFASRLKAGSYVYGGNALPTNRRFYAGGGGSIRGYAYRRVGPKDSDNDPAGGLSLIEGAAELRYEVLDNVQVVPFFDAGVVSAERQPDLGELRYGAGIGLRYLTPIGPIRLDIAAPLNQDAGEDSFAIYAGIGQAF